MSDVQNRLGQYKDSAENAAQHAIDSARTETEKAAAATKQYAHDTKQAVSSSWSSWFGWGKSKAEETKKDAAAAAAHGARDVKEKANEAEKSASKRAV